MTGKKFLDPAVLGEALAQVAELATQEGVRIALLGGFALQHYGSDRLTGNIDIVAERLVRGLPRGTALSFGGEQSEAPNGVPVEVVVRSDDFAPLYRDALEQALRVEGLGLAVPLVRREYLVPMKMVAGRARDKTDLEFLILSDRIVQHHLGPISIRSTGTDRSNTRRIVHQHLGPYAAREWDRLVAETDWKASRGLL